MRFERLAERFCNLAAVALASFKAGMQAVGEPAAQQLRQPTLGAGSGVGRFNWAASIFDDDHEFSRTQLQRDICLSLLLRTKSMREPRAAKLLDREAEAD